MQIHKHLTANNIQLEPMPFLRELSMAAYLIENEGVLALDSEVFSNVEIVETELALKQGRKSKDTDGRIDILATYSKEYIGVIELKYGELAQIHLDQIEDYLEQTNQILKQYPNLIDQALAEDPKWIGLLVGSSIARDLSHKLTEGYLSRQNIPIAALTINRYRGGDGQVYVVTDTYINSKKSSKDYTQYSFEGKTFGKGRLVLAVVRKYVEDHPEISYAELMKAFPKELQGSYGVIGLKDEADKIYASAQIRRYFTKPDEIIQLKDATITVSTEWGSRNIEKFLPVAKKHGYKIQPNRS
jgi:hypothetical protein